MTLSICLCTHSPRADVLRTVIASVAGQEARPGTFELLVVDNASEPPVADDVLAPVRAAGIAARIVREPRPGIARARLRAIEECRTDWILFVDDDNELSPTYVAEGLRFVEARADVGCFGGKLLLPPSLHPPRWARPFLPYLAIKEVGEELLVGSGEAWGPWEPPTAGAFVRRDVAEAFRRAAKDSRVFELGRKGRNGVASSEDSLIMRQTHRLGLLNAYVPTLRLFHHLDPDRFRVRYVLRLMRGYGRSHVLLEAILRGGGGEPPRTPDRYRGRRFLRMLASEFNAGRKQSLAFGMGLVMYHWGARTTYLRRERGEA